MPIVGLVVLVYSHSTLRGRGKRSRVQSWLGLDGKTILEEQEKKLSSRDSEGPCLLFPGWLHWLLCVTVGIQLFLVLANYR